MDAAPRPGCLAIVARLVVSLLRLGVVVAVYAASSLVGSALGFGLSGLLYGFVGLAVLPVALTVGFFVWLLPATARVLSRGGDVEIDALVPTRLDASFFVGTTCGLATFAAYWLPASVWWLPEASFAALALASTGVIVGIGGRHVAEMWMMVVSTVLEGAA